MQRQHNYDIQFIGIKKICNSTIAFKKVVTFTSPSRHFTFSNSYREKPMSEKNSRGC